MPEGNYEPIGKGERGTLQEVTIAAVRDLPRGRAPLTSRRLADERGGPDAGPGRDAGPAADRPVAPATPGATTTPTAAGGAEDAPAGRLAADTQTSARPSPTTTSTSSTTTTTTGATTTTTDVTITTTP